MKKRGLLSNLMVSVIIGLVIFTVLIFLTRLLIVKLSTPIEDQTCAQSALFSSLSKKVYVGSPFVDLNCPQHFVTVVMTQSDADSEEKERKGTKEEILYIDKPLPNALAENVAKWYNVPEGQAKQRDFYLEYRLNEVMAKEMKSCWSRLGGGKLDLFTDWFSGITYKDGVWTGQEGIISKTGKILNPFNKAEYFEAPRVCVICGRVKFSEDVREKFSGDMTSLTDFTLKNPSGAYEGRRPLSYYEFLLDDVYNKLLSSTEGNLKYNYNTGEDMAVVFFRSNLFYLVHTYERVRSFFPGYDEEKAWAPVDAIYLTPYDKVVDDCTLIAN